MILSISLRCCQPDWLPSHPSCCSLLLGEHLGQLLVIGWSVTLCVIIVRTRVLPRWLGVTGFAVSALYLLNQATSSPPPSPASRSGTWPG